MWPEQLGGQPASAEPPRAAMTSTHAGNPWAALLHLHWARLLARRGAARAWDRAWRQAAPTFMGTNIVQRRWTSTTTRTGLQAADLRAQNAPTRFRDSVWDRAGRRPPTATMRQRFRRQLPADSTAAAGAGGGSSPRLSTGPAPARDLQALRAGSPWLGAGDRQPTIGPARLHPPLAPPRPGKV